MIERTATLEDEVRAAVADFRSAAIDLYEAVGMDPGLPQDAARQLGVNKTLTWSMSRVIQAADSRDAALFVPGAASVESLLRACVVAGATEEQVERVRRALRSFDKVVKRHAEDRAGLELLLDSSGGGRSDALELSRKYAFKGTSGIYGVQARTRLACWFAAPNRVKPDELAIATLNGYLGFRYLRDSVRWPLFKRRFWGDRNDLHGTECAPVDPADRLGPGLLKEFCRGEMPALDQVKSPEGVDYILRPGAVGHSAAFDCVMAERLRVPTPRYATETDDTGEFGAAVTTPCEHLVLDALVHRDLAGVLEARLLVFSQIFSQGVRTASPDDPSLLPLPEKAVVLPGSPPAVATPLAPGYAKMTRVVAEKMGWDLKEFVGVRAQIRFPPMGSTVLLRFPLPTARK